MDRTGWSEAVEKRGWAVEEQAAHFGSRGRHLPPPSLDCMHHEKAATCFLPTLPGSVAEQ